MNDVIDIETKPAGALAQLTPPQFVNALVQSGASMEMLERGMAMQVAWEKREAEKAFNRAFAAFKAHAVTLLKTKEVASGPLKGMKHADLAGIVNAATPFLSEHGLSTSWKLTKDAPDWMEVTCTLSHEGGHSESVSMGGAPDTGPGRNAIQARGSAKTYLERYTLTAILGLAAQDADDDGAGGKGADLAAQWIEKAEAAKSESDLTGLWQSGQAEFLAAKDAAGSKLFRATVARVGAALKAKVEKAPVDPFVAAMEAAEKAPK